MSLSKEKLVSLLKYKQELLNRISGPVPEKHKDHVNEFKNFLQNELNLVNSTLEKDKIG